MSGAELGTSFGNLPKAWALARIGEVGMVTTGFTPPKDNPGHFGGVVPFFKPTDLDAGYHVRACRETLSTEGLSYGRMLPEQSILVTCIGATIGKTGLARVPCTTNQQINAVSVLGNSVVPEWLYWWIVSPDGQRSIVENASATTLPIINKSRFSDLLFPVAPEPEQRRVVAELEKQFSRLDAAVAALKRVQASLKRYRASVLRAACEGRLVPTEAELARAEGRDYEPANQLLERSVPERRSRWQAALPSEELPPTPEGWSWTTWDRIADRITVGYVGPMKQEYVDQGVPFLRSQNVRENWYDPEGLCYISPEFHARIAKSRLRPGDLVVVRSGSVGVTCVVPEHLTDANCSDLVVIQNPKAVLPQYGSYWMNSAAQARVRQGTVGIALTHFNTASVAGLPVAVPPIEEQKRIVAEVERRLSVLDENEQAVAASLRRAVRLRQSILKRAFEGKLVPQDPADEPASLLLERIRAERAAAGGGKAARNGRGRKPADPQPALELAEPR